MSTVDMQYAEVDPMNVLKVEDRGLLVPPEYLRGLSPAVRVRPIRGGIVIESADQAEVRDRLRDMVLRLREAAADEPLDPDELARLTDDVRAERAGDH